ncbi:MAG: DUF4965 domain-containing protein [Candidatus Brocadiia bacterium]
MQPIADAAATLGGRFNLIFHPYDRKVYQNATGRFLEQPLELVAGVRTPEGQTWTLPFSSEATPLPFVEQFAALTGISYRGVHPALGLEVVLEIRAPFYPRNVRISTAPFYYVDLTVRRLGEFRHIEPDSPLEQGELVFGLRGEGVEFDGGEGGFRYRFTSNAPARHDLPPQSVTVATWVEAESGDRVGPAELRLAFNLAEEPETRMRLIWSCWIAEPVLQVFDQPATLKYVEAFESRKAMVAWAAEHRKKILKRCDMLDVAFGSWTLGSAGGNLSALAFHSFLADSWWAVRQDGSDWFSVWEGLCYYHSTIDVEYNDALLYFALWPELLGMLLDEWAEFEVDAAELVGAEGNKTAFLCHDMGGDHVVGHQVYSHHMEVEETANYLLMLAAWTAFTGQTEKAKEHLDLCRRLGEFLVKADTSGNGVPDLGTANTIDDASPAVQFGREQTYLAVKAQAALWALAELEQHCGAKGSQAERWRAAASKGVKAVEEGAWLDDHYAVVLDKSTEGLTDPWTGEPLEGEELEGWDDYSIYTANGLLYLFLAGLKMPRWKLNRFARDIETAARRTMTPYGCRHSSGSDRTVWFSQNMWRDYVAAYLGVDMLDNVGRYWDYQAATGSGWGASLYYDTTEGNYLAFYPRGATVLGMTMAAAGLSLNRLEGELTLRPLRGTLDVPLLPLADWKEMRIPVLSVRTRQGVSVARISEPDLLEGLTVTVMGAELEPE